MKESEGQWQEKRAGVKCTGVEAVDQAAGLNALGLMPFRCIAIQMHAWVEARTSLLKSKDEPLETSTSE